MRAFFERECIVKVTEQISRGILVCPRTRQRLAINFQESVIESSDGAHRYAFRNGEVPILLADPKWASTYALESARMVEEYDAAAVQTSRSLFFRLKALLLQDYRTQASKDAFKWIFEGLPADAVCVSVGGGPTRADPRLLNLNLGPFKNVDVVADAQSLPYANDSVDAIHSEAVFEHLHAPQRAAEEMFRVLKPGKRAYICTPFLQSYHGYPHHYQNYTITGHALLFETAGFSVREAGACVGPMHVLTTLGTVFIITFMPFPLNKILKLGWALLSVALRPMDKIFGTRKDAHILASTTYVTLEKPLMTLPSREAESGVPRSAEVGGAKPQSAMDFISDI